jgi:hypothetical protein
VGNIGEPVDRGHGDGLVGAVCDEQVDEGAEPLFPLAELRRAVFTAGDQWRPLVSADLADHVRSVRVVGSSGLVAERGREVGRGGADRADNAGQDLSGAAAYRGRVGEQLLGSDLVDYLHLR